MPSLKTLRKRIATVRATQQITKAMNQVDQVTQRNASAAEELSSTAEEMASQAESLQQLMAFFSVGNHGGGFVARPHVPHLAPAAPQAPAPVHAAVAPKALVAKKGTGAPRAQPHEGGFKKS